MDNDVSNDLKQNGQQVFIDDDLIERLLGGNSSKEKPAAKPTEETPSQPSIAEQDLSRPDSTAPGSDPLPELALEVAPPASPESPVPEPAQASELVQPGSEVLPEPVAGLAIEAVTEPAVVPEASVDEKAPATEPEHTDLRELAESVSAEMELIPDRRMGRGDRRKKRASFAGAFAKAVSLASRGRLDEAILELETAGDDEDAIELRAGLGHLRFEQQNWAEAALQYAAVAQAEPEHPTAHYNLALCLERQGKYADAERAFTAALQITPGRSKAQLGRGLCLLRIGPPAQALACLEACLEAVETNAGQVADRIVFGKAVALHQLGRLSEAYALYQSLLADHPAALDLLTNLLTIAAAHKDWAQAEELAHKLVAAQPESAAALTVLAASAVARGDYALAIQHGSEAVKAAHSAWEAWFNLGVAHHALGDLEAARHSYEEALQSQPDNKNVEAHVNLGAVLQQIGDLAAARALYTQVLQIRPGMLGALWNLGLIAEHEGDAREAERLFGRVAAIRPDWGDVAFRLGLVQFERADYASAASSFETFLAAHPDWTDVKTNLALCRWKLGLIDQASEMLASVLEQDANHKGALSCLGSMSLENLLERGGEEQKSENVGE